MSKKTPEDRVAATLCWCLEDLDMNYVRKMARDDCFREALEDQPASLSDFKTAGKVSVLLKRKDVRETVEKVLESFHEYLKESTPEYDENEDEE